MGFYKCLFIIKRISLLCFLLIYFSCRELVKTDYPDFENAPVINSLLIESDTIVMHISLAGKIDTFQLSVTDNAFVKLFKNGITIDTLECGTNQIYCSNSICETGNVYSSEINIPNYSTIICSDTIPNPVQIDQLIHIDHAGVDSEGHSYPAVQLSFSNQTDKDMYFEIVIRVLDGENGRTAYYEKITDPILLNEGLPLLLFSNKLINEDHYTMRINYTTGARNENGTILYPIIVELRTVSYSYYQYKRHLYLYDQGRFPDGLLSNTTAYPLYSNIEGGYGIFAGYSYVISDTIFPLPNNR
jgi:hypothetical protein